MLHDADGDARLRDLANDLLHGLIGLAFDAGHRLVKQETAGIIHQRAGDAHELLLSIGQVADGFIGGIRQADAGEKSRALARAALAAERILPGRNMSVHQQLRRIMRAHR